ncbi:NADP-specific glutamate dehydrogenase [Prosthecochloris sp. CIB 2401]|uniref:NADP-specific glutamate dehydrogenase n=1 Tax=Prosthecochloris sp. CIB 2401 TaxID=1868325 RepID=UPI00080A967F|nr:NADP-specific glutamate dehydrogenase [Prosthecochloris sp. CIB 2401]ANT64535.1 NAD(P)-specific glutamate dehydrogenase [Prosthecochloris sp. CIB 2401]
MNGEYTLEAFMERIRQKNPGEPIFHQAVAEVAESIIPFIRQHPKYQEECIFERMTEPDRIISFRVAWEDDQGNIQLNRGYRVQFNNSIGPYKGGLRFHPSVNTDILKFLGFEQTFKNSLTTLPMGAAKGGSDFDPKGKSDREVMRFCKSFMTELSHYIGHFTDIPAGDIGVGAREISYMFGEYKRLSHEFTGVLTGKSLEFGGSLIRKEATGYGCAYFMEDMLKEHGAAIEGKSCVVSGSGNVALYCAEKLIRLGGKVMTLSDSSGFIHVPGSIDEAMLEEIIELKSVRRGRLSELADRKGCSYYAGMKPWGVPCELAFPCATENEITKSDAALLAGNGCKAVAEGANMPTTAEAIEVLKRSGILVAPGKASNAGGVAVSGLEMTQNSIRMAWGTEELDVKLRTIMNRIHTQCVEYGKTDGYIDYVKGANIAGFIKVADAMLAYGIV